MFATPLLAHHMAQQNSSPDLLVVLAITIFTAQGHHNMRESEQPGPSQQCSRVGTKAAHEGLAVCEQSVWTQTPRVPQVSRLAQDKHSLHVSNSHAQGYFSQKQFFRLSCFRVSSKCQVQSFRRLACWGSLSSLFPRP